MTIVAVEISKQGCSAQSPPCDLTQPRHAPAASAIATAPRGRPIVAPEEGAAPPFAPICRRRPAPLEAAAVRSRHDRSLRLEDVPTGVASAAVGRRGGGQPMLDSRVAPG